MGVILVRVVNRQSFGWSMELHFPFLFVFLLVLVLIALSILTAWLSSLEATGMGPVRAVREDW
jgi:putative ABC transport system permease protein